MNTIIVVIIGVLVGVLGYRLYSRPIDRRVLRADPKKATPARLYADGVDFMPASRSVLFGFQFKSIAALGPIIGPIVAAQWGWLPALLWILLGTLFVGWVQDYSSVMIGVREEGQTFGALSYRLISPRSRTILLIFIYFYLLLIMGAFGKIVGYDLMTKPSVPLGVLAVLVCGVLAGQMTYVWRRNIVQTTVVTVALSFIGIWLGTLGPIQALFRAINGGEKSPVLFWGITQEQIVWTLVVLVICYVGAVLPMFTWAQPINYVSFWIIALGMLGGVLGLLVWHPGFGDFPAFTGFTVAGL